MFKILLLALCFYTAMYSQSTRNLVNEGVEKYNNKNYADAEVNFKKGTDKDPENFEAAFNLGDTFYKQEKYDEAVSLFNQSLKLTESKNQKAKVYHNIGNSLLKSNKLKESIDAYKNSLKLNPDDQDTKYNLSYALALLNQQQNQKQDQQQQNKDNKENDQQKNQDQNQDKNDQQQDKNDQQQKDQQQQNKPPEDQKAEQDNLKQENKQNMSKEEAEQILNALKNNEEDLQKKLRKKTGIRVKTEKDW